MPFPLPTLDDLRQRARASLAARIPGAAPYTRRSILGSLAENPVPLVWDTIRYLNWQIRQLFPETAEAPYLDRYGDRLGLPRKQATTAAGSVALTASTALTVPAGTLLQSGDASVQLQTAAAIAFTGPGTQTVAVTSITAGASANLLGGAPLYLVAAIAGLSPSGPIVTLSDGVSGLTGGTDAETDAALAARIRQREQRIPQGGASGDYEQWALAVPGVTRAWEYPRNRGTGTIDLTFVMDGRASIIPLAPDLAAVQSALDANRPPVGDSVVFAPVADAIGVNIGALVITSSSTLATVRSAVQTSLAALFGTATPGGATTGPGIDAAHPAGTLPVEQITVAIAETVGVVTFDLLSPTADIVSAHGHLATLAAVSWS